MDCMVHGVTKSQTRLKRLSTVQGSICNAGDLGSIPELGKSPGERNGYPLQYHSWDSPWTEEPGGLQSMGLQRVEQD